MANSQLLSRNEVAARLAMSPGALSVHVSRRSWDKVPRPAKIGGVFKWREEDVTSWIDRQFELSAQEVDKAKRRPGRPRKGEEVKACQR